MKIKDIVTKIETLSPLGLAEEWDNVGLMVGDINEECSGVMLALDLTCDVIGQAEKEGCNLIITHHPFIFHPIKRIDFCEAKGRAIKLLIEKGITVYSAHTNLDKTEGGINTTLCDILGGSNCESDGLGVQFETAPVKLGDFARFVSEKLNDKSVRIVGDPDKVISKVYAVGGSGGSEYARAREVADVLLTGDLKHHNYIDAIEDGFAIVEFSHYASEIIAQDIFENALHGCGVKIIKAKQDGPFRLLEEI